MDSVNKIKAQFALMVLENLSGIEPSLKSECGKYTIYWNQDQAEKMQQWEMEIFDKWQGEQIKRLFNKNSLSEIPDVQIEFMPVLMPIIKKKVLPIAIVGSIALMGIGYLIGRILK